MVLVVNGVVESRLGRDPSTNKRAFLVKRFSPTAIVTPDMRELPFQIEVFEAKLNILSAVGYLLLFLSGPMGAWVGAIPGLALSGATLCLAGLGVGMVLIKEEPRLFKKGRSIRVLDARP